MTWENKKLRCADCKFWWPTSAGSSEPTRKETIFGRCRRCSPLTLISELPDHSPRYAVWATTKRDDWCGEHQHLETVV